MLGLLLGAAILGIIIAAMEEGDFPGWGVLVLCVIAALGPAYLINMALPPEWFIVGLAAGAVCAGFAISALCGMTVKRACIAASIFLATQVGISLLFYLMAGSS